MQLKINGATHLLGYEKITRNSTSNEFNSVNVHKRAGSIAQMQLQCQQIITIIIIIIIINNSSTVQYST